MKKVPQGLFTKEVKERGQAKPHARQIANAQANQAAPNSATAAGQTQAEQTPPAQA